MAGVSSSMPWVCHERTIELLVVETILRVGEEGGSARVIIDKRKQRYEWVEKEDLMHK